MNKGEVISEFVFIDRVEKTIEYRKTGSEKEIKQFETETEVLQEVRKLLSMGFSMLGDWHDTFLLARNKYIKLEK